MDNEMIINILFAIVMIAPCFIMGAWLLSVYSKAKTTESVDELIQKMYEDGVIEKLN